MNPHHSTHYPLQCSGLENSMDCIVHGVKNSWTQLRDFHYHILFPAPRSNIRWGDVTATKSLQSCPTLCDPIDSSPVPHPWDSPGKNIGVGCHFLLQCMKVKSEREVAQSCPSLRDPMDCSLPGSSIHGIFQARVLEWGAIVGWCNWF